MRSERCAAMVVAAVTTVILLLSPPGALAQETTGAVFGVARSQDGEPLPGATVTIENPENGLHREALTGTEGEYRFLGLPPATYDLQVTMDGFRTYRQLLSVALGQAVKSDVEMLLGTFGDTIEVTAERSQLVDVTSTVVGLTVELSDLNDRLPVEREVTAVALLAPGTVPGDTSFDGSTPGQRLASFGGAAVAENLYVVDGLDITNFRTMLGSTRVPFAFLDEVQVKTGGYEAEFGRSTGGVVNMVTRSGSNTLHVEASLYLEPEGLQGTPPDTAVVPQSRSHLETLEGNLSVGGPLIQDRLFYYLFGTYEDSEELKYYTTPSARIPIADGLQAGQPYWGGKVEAALSPGQRLEGTFLSDRTDVTLERWLYDPDSDSLDFTGEGVQARGGDSYILRYANVLDERALLSLQAGRNAFTRTDRSEGDDCPGAIDRRSGRPVVIGCFVNELRGTSNDVREAYRADLDYVAGRHGLRAGIDYERNVSDDDTSLTGGVGYQYFLNGTRFPQLSPDTEVVLVGHYALGGSFPVLSNAAYLQDSWAVSPRLTLNLGLRWERYDNRNGRGETFLETADQLAPRIGAVWDPAGDGRSKVYGSYGRYYLPVASNTNVKAAGAAYLTREWYVLEGGINADGSPEGLGALLHAIVLADGETPDPRTLVADNFEPMSQHEVIVGYERSLGDRWSVGARGVARTFNQVIEDFSIRRGLEATYGVQTDDPLYRIGNPGSAFDGWYDLDGDGVLDRIHLSADALGYPEAVRRYYALELTFDRRQADRWRLQGSYSWSHLYGNYEGYTNSDLGQSDPGLTQTFDFPGLLDHADGDLPNDRRHVLKVFGGYAWPLGLQLGGSFFFRTGRPINSFGLHPTDEDARSYGPDSFYTGGEPRPRGCCGRTDNVWSLDLMTRYVRRIGGVEVSLRVDVFNVFDREAIVEVDELAEDATGALSPTYGTPLVHQTPRRVRLGVGVSF